MLLANQSDKNDNMYFHSRVTYFGNEAKIFQNWARFLLKIEIKEAIETFKYKLNLINSPMKQQSCAFLCITRPTKKLAKQYLVQKHEIFHFFFMSHFLHLYVDFLPFFGGEGEKTCSFVFLKPTFCGMSLANKRI